MGPVKKFFLIYVVWFFWIWRGGVVVAFGSGFEYGLLYVVWLVIWAAVAALIANDLLKKGAKFGHVLFVGLVLPVIGLVIYDMYKMVKLGMSEEEAAR